MKLRILNNSIRLRLTQGEVDTIAETGLLRSRVAFAGGQHFDYVLESSPATVTAEAEFSNNVLTVRLPMDEIKNWVSSDQVSIENTQSLSGDESLKILIEKDFACLAPREGEDESDMFPHPMQGQESC